MTGFRRGGEILRQFEIYGDQGLGFDGVSVPQQGFVTPLLDRITGGFS
jgi:hypothetical protein